MQHLRVLNIIQYLSLGGAARAMAAVSKYASRNVGVSQDVVSLLPADATGIELAHQNNMNFLPTQSFEDILKLIPEYDIVQVQWWNNAELGAFFREKLPPCRLLLWCHVGGHQIPQVIPDDLIDYADFIVACSPHTYNCPTIQKLPYEVRKKKIGMAYGAADFERIGQVQAVPHNKFQIGYIGTVDYSKMHPDFVEMSLLANIPDAHFVVAGEGGALDSIRNQIHSSENHDRFELCGYVHDIVPLLQRFDVYGYPLCEDNYSGSEINLQEVMYAGIPPVVFPYGGIKHLVMNDYTGLVVHSKPEYADALEFLYHNPQERKRLGENARKYAAQIFTAERAANAFLEYYSIVLKAPKSYRMYGQSIQEGIAAREISVEALQDLFEQPAGHVQFISSLGEMGTAFETSSTSNASLHQLMEADNQISIYSQLVKSTLKNQYMRFFKEDPYLPFWSGLISLQEKDFVTALQLFDRALQCGFSHWRIWAYVYHIAKILDEQSVYEVAYKNLESQLNKLTSEENKILRAQFQIAPEAESGSVALP